MKIVSHKSITKLAYSPLKKKNRLIILGFFVIFLIVFSIFTARIADPFQIENYLYPGCENETLPVFGEGKLIAINNEDRIAYSYFARNNKTNKMIVLFHGNAEAISRFDKIGSYFFQAGYSMLVPEYPGYGVASKYQKSESLIYSDCTSTIRHIQDRFNITADNTFLIGYSLGTGIATEMLKRKLGNKMILIAPYTSISDVLGYKTVPMLPRLFVTDNFNTRSKAKKIGNAVLLIHGKDDKKIPCSMSVTLHQCFRNSELMLVDGLGHNIISSVLREDILSKEEKFLSN